MNVLDPADRLCPTGEHSPVSLTEKRLAEIWVQLMSVQHVARHDNFFALGGHSLLAIRLLSHIEAVLGVSLTLTQIFNAPTLASLGTEVDAVLLQENPPKPLRAPVSKTGNKALSSAQKRLWFIDQLAPGYATYNTPMVLTFTGPLNHLGLSL